MLKLSNFQIDGFMNDVLARLQNWYSSQCNGEWEHSHGVTIETIDNPGWTVEIDLKDTRWENVSFEDLDFERAPGDWVRCSKKDAHFKGNGDPSKLDLILNHFLTQVENSVKT